MVLEEYLPDSQAWDESADWVSTFLRSASPLNPPRTENVNLPPPRKPRTKPKEIAIKVIPNEQTFRPVSPLSPGSGSTTPRPPTPGPVQSTLIAQMDRLDAIERLLSAIERAVQLSSYIPDRFRLYVCNSCSNNLI